MALAFSERYHKDGREFLKHIVRVTGVETWVSFVNVETKEQSKQWVYTHHQTNRKHLKKRLSARKLMAAVVWDRKGMLMVEFVQHGTTITLEVYGGGKKT
jgi:hypothetical protein